MSKSLRLVLARERCTRGGAACPIIVQKQHVLGPLQRHIAGHTSGLTIMVSFVAGVAVQESCAPLAITATARKTREAPQPATKPFPSRIPSKAFPFAHTQNAISGLAAVFKALSLACVCAEAELWKPPSPWACAASHPPSHPPYRPVRHHHCY